MIISGVVLFNPNSSANRNDTLNTPIAKVPVVLQEQGDTSIIGSTTGTGAAAITDVNGRFNFTNVRLGHTG